MEPDVAALRILTDRLGREGMDPEPVQSFDTLLQALDRRPPDLTIAAIGRHGGTEQLLTLRQRSIGPLMVLLWGDGAGMDVADALESGADDGIEKPYSPRLLVARCRALLRRAGAASLALTDPSLRFDGLTIDLASREVLVDEQLAPMPRREFDLLAFMARVPRQTFTRAELLRNVWGADSDWLGTSTVTEHVRRLRKRIERDPARPRWVITVRSVGYRFEP